MRIAFFAIGLMTACASCAGAKPSRSLNDQTPAAARLSADDTVPDWLLKDLATIATNGAVTSVPARFQRLRVSDLPAYADELVHHPNFAATVVPDVLFAAVLGKASHVINREAARILKQTPPDGTGRTAYYLRRPCAVTDAKEVNPWWDLKTTVLVCDEAYQPSVYRPEPSPVELPITCNVSELFPAQLPTCGCGPNLMRCERDKEHYASIKESLIQEISRTTEYIVANDLPMSELFTSTSTMRDRQAEAVNRWLHAESVGGKADFALSDWPEAGKWAPRTPAEQQAGVLTTPQMLNFNLDTRQRMRVTFEMAWCSEPSSVGATAQAMLALGGNQLQIRHDGWRELAARPLCTDCHARLDYGDQFFSAYPATSIAMHYMPQLSHSEKGSFYGDDIQDERGSAPRTPASFAKLLTSQPEFGRCMARRLGMRVFGNELLAADEDALAASFRTNGTARSLMREAMVLYAKKRLEAAKSARAPASPAPDGPPSTAANAGAAAGRTPQAPGAAVEVSPNLRSMFDAHCVMCHDSGNAEGIPVLEGGLTRSLALRVLDQIGSRRMPKKGLHLDPATRDAMLRMLTSALWTDPSEQDAALHYFRDPHATRTLALNSAFGKIHTLAGATPATGTRVLERVITGDHDEYTPGFEAMVLVEGLRSCRAAALPADAIEACVARVTAPSAVARP